MWGSDEYGGFPVINQTATCLSPGWPPVQNASALPGGASAETAETPFFLFLSPSPPPLPTSDSYRPHPAVPLVTRLSLSADAKKRGLVEKLRRLGGGKQEKEGE